MSGNPDNLTDVQGINPIVNEDGIDAIRDPLNFSVTDADFLEYAKKLKKDDDTFWNQKGSTGYSLKERRLSNENYYFGRQLQFRKLKKYNSRALDNIIYEAEQYLRAMGLSKLPDITVNPGNESDLAKAMADELGKVVTSDLQSRARKRVLGMAFKHLPVYFIGAIKVFWNPQKGKYGDYDFKVVHPENLTLDYRASSNDVVDHDHLFETCEASVKELVMRFPTKKKEIFDELRAALVFNEQKNENTEAGMATKVKYQEVWFKWFDQPTDDKQEWQVITGVGWYYNKLLLGKSKHPFWDWTGQPQTFKLDYKQIDENSKTFKQEKTVYGEQDIRSMLLQGQTVPGTENETVFHNHLDFPEFPYILIGMDQWGKTPIDETSRIEQAIPVQEDYDHTSRQISEMLDRSRGKHVYSSSEGLEKKDIAQMDNSNPDQDILIKGNVRDMHVFIPGEQPSPALIADHTAKRERIFDKEGVHGATRGEVTSDTAATNNQLSREGDFSRMDDLVDDTINYAAEKMANWEMQMIKLFYTENHMRRILGPDGKWLTVQLQRDLLDDGMEVTISASGSDKLKAEQRAMDQAKLKMTDPYRFFKDTGASDPRGRTLSLMNFLMNPQLYQQDILDGGDGTGAKGVGKAAATVNDAGTAIEGEVQDGASASPQAGQDIMLIQQGQVPQVPPQVDPAYINTMEAFAASPQFDEVIQAHPELKQPLAEFLKQIVAVAQQSQQNPTANAVATPPPPNPAAQFGTEGNGQNVGPLAGNPSPQNTSRIAAVPGQ